MALLEKGPGQCVSLSYISNTSLACAVYAASYSSLQE
ncbi:MAG: hypothetical protein JWR72_2955, partial [Flavisolibacter sp.]|nr:hypothetical protein [Flavisolibacter sp.]